MMIEERGWVLEAGNEPRYWTGLGTKYFSTDEEKAIRFARRRDAECARAWLCQNHALRVAEHTWFLEE